MLLNGEKLDGPRIETLVVPFKGRNVIFKAQLVANFDDFEKICPRPKPAVIVKPGGIKSFDVEHPDFRKALEDYSSKRSDWTVLKSLAVTPNLTWETVDMSKPETWSNYRTELELAGFSTVEYGKIMDLVVAANGLDQAKIDKATERFLAEEAARSVPSSHQDVAPNT